MSDALQALQRQLRIKSGVVNRLLKEHNLYIQEEEAQRWKVEKLKADGADGADIRQAETVLNEAKRMVPDARGRLGKAVEDLKDFMIQAQATPKITEDLEYAKAKEALEQAEL